MNEEGTRQMTLELKQMMDGLRAACPLVHHITNYVTVNDCANMTLAAGASPVMADDPKEAADMTATAQALVINIGTLNERTISSMLAAGRRAKRKGIPVVFDPVGCGATAFRTETARTILREVRPSVVRGNISEIGSLFGLDARTKGVDASSEDAGRDALTLARDAAQSWGCVVAVTGAEDIVTDGRGGFAIDNGCAAMGRITGTGCMCTSVTAAFCGAFPDRLLEASAAALVFIGLSGEIAWEAAKERGLGSFHGALFDVASRMTGDRLEKEANYHET